MSKKITIENVKNIYPEISLGTAVDHQGEKRNHLTYLYRTINKGKNVTWVAQCDCGNFTIVTTSAIPKTKSCGCLKNKIQDLTNKKFGRLLVINLEKKDNRKAYWRCKCDCGNECVVRSDSLIGGKTKSCGCLIKEKAAEIGRQKIKDLTNQRFGLLTALFPTDQRIDSSVIWKCQCDCGNIAFVKSTNLVTGDTRSCGCIKTSFWELLIEKILKENNLTFEREKQFNSCKFPDTNKLARFDFYVNNEYLIEYDGAQHFSFTDCGWNTKENYLKTKQRDEYKNNWCKKNNIPLIRIPYTHKNICIEDLQLTTSNFLIGGKN